MKSNRILIETLIVLILSVGGILFIPEARTIFVLLPIVYLLVERSIRQRSWTEIGFKQKSFWPDLRANFWLVLFVGVFIQLTAILLAKIFFPEFLLHVKERLPVDAATLLALLPLLAITILGEEMSFRSLFQGRLAIFFGAPLAILFASIAFGLSHFSPGTYLVVAVDLGLVMIDGLVYGVIYNRSGNVLVAWIAHFLADVIALVLLLTV